MFQEEWLPDCLSKPITFHTVLLFGCILFEIPFTYIALDGLRSQTRSHLIPYMIVKPLIDCILFAVFVYEASYDECIEKSIPNVDIVIIYSIVIIVIGGIVDLLYMFYVYKAWRKLNKLKKFILPFAVTSSVSVSCNIGANKDCSCII